MLRRILYVLFLFVVIVSLLFVKVLLYDIPSLKTKNPRQTAFMKSKRGGGNHKWVPLSQIPDHLQRAVIAAEDGSFYQHHGIDFYEIKQSMITNIKKKRFARGGSTITMQLAKNLYLNSDKSLHRKLLEVPYAWKMERDLSKKRILEIYLNVIEWGKGVFGIDQASQFYFKKPASKLSVKEAAFLAAIIPNPKKWGHWPPKRFIEKRMDRILRIINMKTKPSPNDTLDDESSIPDYLFSDEPDHDE